MSIQDKFDQIIEENIPLLIKSITNFKAKDDNFKICKQFMVSKIRHHNFLSINSHEIRKRVNGFLERLRIANFGKVAERFDTLSENFINNQICLQHHQTDIQWGILKLLLEISYNPVGELTRKLIHNRAQYDALFIDLTKQNIEDDISFYELSNHSTMISVRRNSYSNSDLSEWSESESDTENEYTNRIANTKPDDIILQNDLDIDSEKWKIVTYLSPPKKNPHYTEFNSSESAKWIAQNIQYSWWNDPEYICPFDGTFLYANFCNVWDEFLLKNSLDVLQPIVTSQVSEYCAYREILWMFTSPGDFKFFGIHKGCIVPKPNVSIPSVTEVGFRLFLTSFSEYMTYMHELRLFCRNIFRHDHSKRQPPKTYLDYAFCIEEFLQPVYNLLVEKERLVTNLESQTQRTVNPFSLIKLHQELQESFNLLRNLYNIHTSAVLDYNKFPAHICTTNLQAKLYAMLQETHTNPKEGNLIFVIFIKTFRVFLTTLDKWLIYGNLEYGGKEFLIERDLTASTTNLNKYKSKQFSKCKDQLFYVPSYISNEIEKSELITMLLSILLNTAPTIDMLYKLDRMGELRVNHLNQMLMQDMNELFMASVLEEIDRYRVRKEAVKNYVVASLIEEKEEAKQPNKNGFNRHNFEKRVKTIGGDEFLLAAFTKTLNSIDEINQSLSYVKTTSDSVQFYERLNKNLTLLAPHTLIITTALKGILKKKLLIVSQFLTNIYKEELQIVKHLRNLRQVLLMEAGDLMYDFYTRLFEEMETGTKWANPYRLTVQLYAALYSRYPNILFSVQITGNAGDRVGNALSSINLIRLNYNVPDDLESIISTDNLNLYNKIFNLILKTKWSITMLENLKNNKTRIPYAKLKIEDIMFRRLFMLKMWLMYSIQSVHNYIYGVVIEIYSKNLDQKIESATSLTEIIDIHKAFITKICDLCFLSAAMNPILYGILQLLELVYVLKLTWDSLETQREFVDVKAIDEIEQTYICCHQYLVDALNKAAYKDSNFHLTTLADAFSCSVPY